MYNLDLILVGGIYSPNTTNYSFLAFTIFRNLNPFSLSPKQLLSLYSQASITTPEPSSFSLVWFTVERPSSPWLTPGLYQNVIPCHWGSFYTFHSILDFVREIELKVKLRLFGPFSSVSNVYILKRFVLLHQICLF